MVFNKSDLVEDPAFSRIVSAAYPGSISISALELEDALKLRDHIYEYFATHFFETVLKIPHDDQATLRFVFDTCRVLESDYSNHEFVQFKVQTTQSAMARLRPFSEYDEN